MSAAAANVRIERYGSEKAREIADQLGALYHTAYKGTAQEYDRFYSPERFAQRLRGYTRADGFLLATATDSDELIGYAFGYLLPSEARWWDGLIDTVPEDFTTEDGRRTFALCELHVKADRRGQGIASDLHQELVVGGHERLTVLVRPENIALRFYMKWGYELVGRLQPYPDSPIYLALVLPIKKEASQATGAP